MKTIEIQISNGLLAQPVVDPFYERNGGKACARPDDLFFLAVSGNALRGCVRYCEESSTPMLRTMMVDEGFRRRGVGRLLLNAFSDHLDQHGIHDVFCVPYSHLEHFYCSAGFRRVAINDAPSFLQHRLIAYDSTLTRYICMKRS